MRDYLSREDSRARYAPGVEFHIGQIEMVANTGTYLDAPFHRYAGRKDVAQLPLERLADIPAVVVRVPAGRPRGVRRSAFAGHELGGKAVLVRTSWDQHWGTPAYLDGHPYLTAEAAEYGFRFSAVPAKVSGFGSWPVRAFAAL